MSLKTEVEELPEPNLPPKEYSRKPDPEEPWRYVCPDVECRGQVRGHPAHSRFRCSQCGSSFTITELYDQKKNEILKDKGQNLLLRDPG